MKIGVTKYLRASDLVKPQLVTIERVDEEEMPDGEISVVVYFTEVPSGIVLNKGHKVFLVESFSDETDNWVGHAIVIYNDPNVEYQGRRTGGIRMRMPKEAVPRKNIAPSANGRGAAMHHDDRSGYPADQDDLPF